ncbi:hypothetical protein EV651_1391 [Kribbella sp. VKM Ac-2571]|nr:hypothetical protein EV651_1391 [Kribbella sp. VKM Ac-2571]
MDRDDYERITDWGTTLAGAGAGADADRHGDAGELRTLFAFCAPDPRPTGALTPPCSRSCSASGSVGPNASR